MKTHDNIRLQAAINQATDAIAILDKSMTKRHNVNLAYSYIHTCLNQLLLFKQELKDFENKS